MKLCSNQKTLFAYIVQYKPKQTKNCFSKTRASRVNTLTKNFSRILVKHDKKMYKGKAFIGTSWIIKSTSSV